MYFSINHIPPPFNCSYFLLIITSLKFLFHMHTSQTHGQGFISQDWHTPRCQRFCCQHGFKSPVQLYCQSKQMCCPNNSWMWWSQQTPTWELSNTWTTLVFAIDHQSVLFLQWLVALLPLWGAHHACLVHLALPMVLLKFQVKSFGHALSIECVRIICFGF
jgi:hypothetical protein